VGRTLYITSILIIIISFTTKEGIHKKAKPVQGVSLTNKHNTLHKNKLQKTQDTTDVNLHISNYTVNAGKTFDYSPEEYVVVYCSRGKLCLQKMNICEN